MCKKSALVLGLILSVLAGRAMALPNTMWVASVSGVITLTSGLAPNFPNDLSHARFQSLPVDNAFLFQQFVLSPVDYKLVYTYGGNLQFVPISASSPLSTVVVLQSGTGTQGVAFNSSRTAGVPSVWQIQQSVESPASSGFFQGLKGWGIFKLKADEKTTSNVTSFTFKGVRASIYGVTHSNNTLDPNPPLHKTITTGKVFTQAP